jgi:hypothetical protein
MSNPLNELVGKELVSELWRRLAESDLTIARLLDREAAGDWKAKIDLDWEYSRKEKIEDMLSNVERGGKRNGKF